MLLDEEVIGVARDASVALLGYSPLLGGAYTRTDRDLPDGFQHDGTGLALTTLREVADAHGLDAGQTVLAWMSQRTEQVIPIVGLSRREQLISAINAVATPLEAAALEALDAARAGASR